jgi:transposase-like protein
MRKNIMRTPAEKEKIVKEYRNTPITLRAIAEKYHTEIKVINTWVNKYEKYGIKGLESQTGRKKGGNKGQGARKPKSIEEELGRKIMKLEIENARLKKGYIVKGDGAEKEYVTTLEKNTK